jgi:2-phosphosulfolactate phosphatase
MPSHLNVYGLPKYATPKELSGGTAVVIDVLRATTTIVYALEAGAKEVIPCREIEDAEALAEKYPREDILLAGERGGKPIANFDMGNSPEEFLDYKVEGKTILFTTTNGTLAMSHARDARRILLAAFVNVSAVVQKLLGADEVHILCAGTDGEFSQDDILLAGLIVERLNKLGGQAYEMNAQATTAREFWMHSFALPQALGAEPIEPERLEKELRGTLGAKNLIGLGYDDDILAASRIDQFKGVPELDKEKFSVRLA